LNRSTATLFYDGLCPLCSREIAHYRTKFVDDAVQFVDVADPAFDAPAHGLDPVAVHKLMHIKVGDEVRVGLAAFIALWERLPAYRWLARLAKTPGVHFLLNLGYRAFAKVRPWLPRRKGPLCESGTCAR
jgi:predicted DCC family thiol-disulfide oxidoreductase YuxK